MKSSHFTFQDPDGIDVFVYKWTPEGKPKAAIQIAHGMAEHAARYARPAESFVHAGYVVYANDHRGHKGTAKDLVKKGQLGPGGWEGMVQDLKQLTEIIKSENPGLPVFLLGHSMGSFLSQAYIQRWGTELKGVILSGSTGTQPKSLLFFGKLIAKLVAKLQGPNAPGKFLDKMSFGRFNKPFAPAKTKFDWLSRDETEVKKYADDPWCGFVCPNNFFVAMISGLSTLWNNVNEAQIPKTLPLYLFSGSQDPVSNKGKGVVALFNRYQKLGIKDVRMKLYEGGRHEMFNETNRDEVYQDVIAWLDTHV